MTKFNTLIAGAAAVAVTLGVMGGEGTIPKQLQTPLWNGDIVIVKDEAIPGIGQTDTVRQSAEMGKADGVKQT